MWTRSTPGKKRLLRLTTKGRGASTANDDRQESGLASSGLLSRLGWSSKKIKAAVGLPVIALVIGIVADVQGTIGSAVGNYNEGRAHEKIEAAVRGHYEAIGTGDYRKAYGYFGSVMRNTVGTEPLWIEGQNKYCPVAHPHGVDVKDVRVSEVDGNKAVATADVEFDHTCGESHWIFAWNLLEESDGWKLDSQIPEASYALYTSVPTWVDNGDVTVSEIDGEGEQANLESVETSATAEPAEDASGKLVSYEPAKAIDGEDDTAWQVAENGKNEWIMLKYETPVKVRRLGLIPGYDKVDRKDRTDRFYQMYVVREALIEFSDGYSHRASFKRDREMQFVDVPDRDTTSVRITILDTYPPELENPSGATYDMLLAKAAISEIKVEGP